MKSESITGKVAEPLPNSPIAGQDDIPVDVGATELRRARAMVEVCYRAEPGEMVDIQARIFDAVLECGADGIDYRRPLQGDGRRDLGDVLVEVDLLEHVRFVDGENEAADQCPECHGRGMVQKSAHGTYGDRGNGWGQVWSEPCPRGCPGPLAS